MNPKAIAIAAFPLLFAVQATAGVIINDAKFIDSIFAPGKQILTLSQSIPSGQGLFAFAFSVNDSLDTVIEYRSIAERCSLFSVPVGVTFDASYVASHLPLVSNHNNPGSVTLPYLFPSPDMILAYWDDRADWSGSGPHGEPDMSDFYGWLAVSFTEKADLSGITWTAVDGATALGQGIVVGSYTQIPEPGNCGLVLAASAILFLARRKRASTS